MDADELQYRVPRKDSDFLRSWISKGISGDEANKMKSEFTRMFDSKTFDLACPELDLAVARRLAKLSKLVAVLPSKPMDQEKAFITSQEELLDIVRPLVVVWSQVDDGDPVREPLSVAIQNWARSFRAITQRRRLSILERTFFEPFEGFVCIFFEGEPLVVWTKL